MTDVPDDTATGLRATRPSPTDVARRGPAVLRFGPAGRFELHAQERRLCVDGQPVALGSRAFDLLHELARRPGELRGKHDLMEAVWPGVVVEEGNLATQVSALRKVLGGDVIATIPGRGYRFTARVDGEAPVPVVPPPAPACVPDAAGAPAAPPDVRGRTHLPADLPPLLGRADDLATLAGLVTRHRLVTLVGPGGVGKTRLAQAVLQARREDFRHGVCWVDLAAVDAAPALAPTLASALGLPLGPGDPVAALGTAAAPLDILVALDNAEHLLDAVADLVQALLRTAPALRLLVTSQAPLKLPAEHVQRLGALAVPAAPMPVEQVLAHGAVALFVERVRQADTRFVLTDALVPAVVSLCRQLDGLPLAIELAAARVPMLGVPHLAASMHERLRLLTRGRDRGAPPRQQTLRTALEWSHGFLSPAEATVFRRLAVFAGSASLDAVQQVAADPPGEGPLDEWSVLDALGGLVDRSLVVAEGDGAAGARYRLLESPRLLAQEKLRAAGEAEALARRHAEAVARQFDAAWQRCHDGSVGWDDWEHQLQPELENGRAALGWARTVGETGLVLRIGPTLARALPRSAQGERLAVVDGFDDLAAAESDPCVRIRARLAFVAAMAAHDLDRARRCAQQALDDSAEVGDAATRRWLRHRTLCQQLMLDAWSRRDGGPDAARRAEAAALLDPAWPPQRRLAFAEVESCLVAGEGDPARALAAAREHLALAQAAGARHGVAGVTALANLVDAHLAAGDAASAARTGEFALAMLIGSRDEQAQTVTRLNVGAAWLALGDTARARTVLQAGWSTARLFDWHPYYADVLARLAALEGRCTTAARLIGWADARNAAAGPREPNEQAAVDCARRRVRAALGEAVAARLAEDGRTMDDDTVDAIVFGTLDPA